MSMKVESRSVKGVLVLDCSGRLTQDGGAAMLRDSVRSALSQGQKQILLNLANVNYVDSSGLGELVSAYTTVRNQGGNLKLLAPPRRSTTYCNLGRS